MLQEMLIAAMVTDLAIPPPVEVAAFEKQKEIQNFCMPYNTSSKDGALDI